jgi:hypothetical protein
MTKYKNALNGKIITIYPWSKKEDKIKVQGKNWYRLFEG